MNKSFSFLTFSTLIFATACTSPSKAGRHLASQGESCQKIVQQITPQIFSIFHDMRDPSLLKIRAAGRSNFYIPVYPRAHMNPYDPNPYQSYYLVVDIENIRTHKRERVSAPPKWRQKHIERHNRIWALSRQAIAGRNVEKNVTEIMKYLDEDYEADEKSMLMELPNYDAWNRDASGGGFYDVVEQALGEVRSPLAARKLMASISRDINRQKNVPYEKNVTHHFWGTQALGSLDYSKDEALRVEVETFLMNLADQYYKAGRKNSYSAMDALSQPAFNTPRVREFISQLMERPETPTWDIWRVFLTWDDPSTAPLILKLMKNSDMQEISFTHGLTLLQNFHPRFKDAGLNEEQIFREVVDAWESRESQWLNQLGGAALAALIPDHCLPSGI